MGALFRPGELEYGDHARLEDLRRARSVLYQARGELGALGAELELTHAAAVYMAVLACLPRSRARPQSVGFQCARHRMAAFLRCSERTFDRARDQLIAAGWVIHFDRTRPVEAITKHRRTGRLKYFRQHGRDPDGEPVQMEYSSASVYSVDYLTAAGLRAIPKRRRPLLITLWKTISNALIRYRIGPRGNDTPYNESLSTHPTDLDHDRSSGSAPCGKRGGAPPAGGAGSTSIAPNRDRPADLERLRGLLRDGSRSLTFRELALLAAQPPSRSKKE